MPAFALVQRLAARLGGGGEEAWKWISGCRAQKIRFQFTNGEMPAIPACDDLARSGGARGRPCPSPVLHRGHDGAARENTAGRVMLRAYRRGAGHRLQGLR